MANCDLLPLGHLLPGACLYDAQVDVETARQEALAYDEEWYRQVIEGGDIEDSSPPPAQESPPPPVGQSAPSTTTPITSTNTRLSGVRLVLVEELGYTVEEATMVSWLGLY